MVRADTGGSGAHGHLRLAVLRWQVPFAAVVLVTALGALALAPGSFRNALVVSAAVITLVATILAATVPWWRLPSRASAAIPLLDMVAVVVAEVGGFPAGPLLLLPVLTLAATAAPGLVLAIGAGTGASWVSELLSADNITLASSVPGLVLRPTVLTAAAVALHLSERRSAARHHLATGQSELVEELLADSRADQQLINAVLNTIDTEVIVLDAQGAVRTVNRATVVAHGGRLAPGTVAAELAVPLLAADGRTPLPVGQTPLVRAARGERIDREVIWADTDGGTHGGRRTAYRVSAAPLPGEAGTSTGAVVALEDLTRELEALAKREEFVSSVSHELRTPLTSVTGYLDLVMEAPELADDTRLHLSVAARNAGRLEILIANLLAAARDGAPPPTTAVDLTAVVRDVVEDQTPRATDAQITLQVSAPQSCVVGCDLTRMTQVVDNLVSNAIKYSTAGGRVVITLAMDDHGASSPPGGADGPRETAGVRLRVADDGVGIGAADLPHVFDRFYRARAARDSTVQGTGLGLPITRRIVEELGGTITLESAAGRGTCVDVALPATGGTP